MLLPSDEPHIVNWVYGVLGTHAGGFLKNIAGAAIRADVANYGLLRPVLLQLVAKYPDYMAHGERIATEDHEWRR